MSIVEERNEPILQEYSRITAGKELEIMVVIGLGNTKVELTASPKLSKSQLRQLLQDVINTIPIV